MKLGNRVTSTQAQDYKRAHRFADLTYSGVINDESNINRLNEFNGGLLNFKACEDSFDLSKLLMHVEQISLYYKRIRYLLYLQVRTCYLCLTLYKAER